MARRKAVTVTENTALETINETGDVDVDTELADVDIPTDDEVEDIATSEGEDKADDKPKKEVAPKRGDLEDGDVTPVALAKILSQPIDGNAENLDESNWRYTKAKDGSHEVVPQMVYSYLKTAKGLTIRNGVVDSNGVARNNVLKLDEALAWWDEKNKRTAERTQNAKDKAERKATKADSTETASSDDVTPSGEVEEVE